LKEQLNIAETISGRWSPRAFDATREVEAEKLKAIFEAARWAPSSSNLQPWHFIVGYNFDDCHGTILSTLNEGNRIWAQNAPLLLITVAKMSRGDRPNRFALHDVGLATENLFLQAYAVGLSCHFMGGFSQEKAKELFNIPEDYEPVTAGAIGYLGGLQSLPDDLREREQTTRQRRSLDEFVFTNTWNNPLGIG
jgi:nitroreductase